MRILLDENVPRKLKYRFGDEHSVITVPEKGWAGYKNGQLLSAAEGEFDVIISIDKGLPYQQYLKGRSVGLLVVNAQSNTYEDVVTFMPSILRELVHVSAGSVIRVSG